MSTDALPALDPDLTCRTCGGSVLAHGPHGGPAVAARDCCTACIRQHRLDVSEGRTTWAELESQGRVAPSGRAWERPHHRNPADAEHRQAVIRERDQVRRLLRSLGPGHCYEVARRNLDEDGLHLARDDWQALCVQLFPPDPGRVVKGEAVHDPYDDDGDQEDTEVNESNGTTAPPDPNAPLCAGGNKFQRAIRLREIVASLGRGSNLGQAQAEANFPVSRFMWRQAMKHAYPGIRFTPGPYSKVQPPVRAPQAPRADPVAPPPAPPTQVPDPAAGRLEVLARHTERLLDFARAVQAAGGPTEARQLLDQLAQLREVLG